MMTDKTEHMMCEQFEDAFCRAKDGVVIVYATGFIALALYEAEKRGENIGRLVQLQKATYELYQHNELYLTQRRLGDRATKATK
jgi:hypothetical protein